MLGFQQEVPAEDDELPMFRRTRRRVIEEAEEEQSKEMIGATTASRRQHAPPPPQVVRPAAVRVARPVALKVIRPIPRKAVEDFYNEAYRQGIAGTEVHAAAAIAQDWHRKWTQQDEEGHTMPESNQRTTDNGLIPEHYAYNLSDRDLGAKNPSPDDLHSEFERKRSRQGDYFRSDSSVSDSSSTATGSKEDDDSSSSSSSLPMPIPKRPAHEEMPIGPVRPEYSTKVERQQQQGGPPPQSQAFALVRPVAVRVVRPPVVIPPEEDNNVTVNSAIPQHIMNSLRHQNLHRHLSPLTIPSNMSTATSITTRTPKALSPLEMNEIYNDFSSIPSEISHPNHHFSRYFGLPHHVNTARRDLLHALAAAGGDAGHGTFNVNLDVLAEYFAGLDIDTRPAETLRPTEGTWLTLTKPSFFGNLGDNDHGDPMYTLGRMTFDMFSPTSLVCSLQGNFNIVKQVPQETRSHLLDAVPVALKDDVENSASTLRTYDIVTAFTIEPSLPAYPNAPNKDVRRPIRGIMTTKGYMLSDPEVNNRHSVWITGGRIEPNDDPVDQREWKRQFGLNPPKHSMGEKAKLLAVKMLMGAKIPTEMNEDGSLEYEFTRPLGGHGVAYVDLLYVDDSLRVVRGHRGTVFVFSKLPNKTDS